MKNLDSLSTRFYKLKKLLIFSMFKATDQQIPDVKILLIVELKLAMSNLGFQAKNQTIYQMICDLEADGSGNINFEHLNKYTAN